MDKHLPHVTLRVGLGGQFETTTVYVLTNIGSIHKQSLQHSTRVSITILLPPLLLLSLEAINLLLVGLSRVARL